MRPIASGSISIWIAGVPIFGTAQKCVVMPPVSVADEADEIGAVDDAVGALARIGADHADRKRMVARDRVLAVERGRDRNLQRFGERHQLGRRAGCAHAAARDDDRTLRLLQMLQRRRDAGIIGRRTERRHPRKLRLAQRLHLRLLGIDLPSLPRNCRCTGPGVPDVATRNACRTMSGKRATSSTVALNLVTGSNAGMSSIFLIDLAELGLRLAPAGHGDHRRVREPGVAQTGGEVERADHLRRADAGLAGGARIAIGHVGRRLLAMHVQALDVGAGLHHGEGFAQHRRHVEYVGDAVALEHVGEAFGPAHFPIVSEHHSLRR